MKHRARRLDNGELITGYYVTFLVEKHGGDFPVDRVCHCILEADRSEPDLDAFEEIDPATLAMETLIPDKHGNMIYGSVPVEGKMSKGGDIVNVPVETNYGFAGIQTTIHSAEIYFSSGCFWWKSETQTDCNWHFYSDLEITGKQFDNTKNEGV